MNEYEMVELVRDTLGWGYGHDLEAILAQVRREAKVEALREARNQVFASSFWADGSDNYADRVRGWLSRRADQLEQEGKNDE